SIRSFTLRSRMSSTVAPVDSIPSFARLVRYCGSNRFLSSSVAPRSDLAIPLVFESAVSCLRSSRLFLRHTLRAVAVLRPVAPSARGGEEFRTSFSAFAGLPRIAPTLLPSILILFLLFCLPTGCLRGFQQDLLLHTHGFPTATGCPSSLPSH